MANILDDAKVLDWNATQMAVLLDSGIQIEILHQRGALVIRQTQLMFEGGWPPRSRAQAVNLAFLPCARSFWAPSARGTLAQARRIVRAHARLTVIYPDLIWDAILRERPDYVGDPCAGVSCIVRGDVCQVEVGRRVPPFDLFAITEPALVRATGMVTCTSGKHHWVPYNDTDTRVGRLFSVPEPVPVPTAHARLSHRGRIQAYRQELERDILPLLVS